MSAFSNYLENAVLDHILRNDVYTPSANIYLALFTASTGLEENNIAGASEVSGGSYTRVNISTSGGFSAASGGTTTNVNDLVFPTATDGWGTVSHIAILDAASDGNVLFWGALTTSRDVLVGDSVRVRAGNYTITLQ